MLKKYRDLKAEISTLENKLKEIDLNLERISNEISMLKEEITIRSRNMENQMSENTRKLFSRKLQENLEEITKLSSDLNNYKNNSMTEFGLLKSKIETNEFIDLTGFNKIKINIKTILNSLDTVIIEQGLNYDIDLLKDVDILTLKSNLSFNDIIEYLNYFNNFDLINLINNYASEFFNLINKINDELIYSICIGTLIIGLFIFKFYIFIPYIFILIGTLIVRIIQFIYSIRLANMKSTLTNFDDKLELYKNNAVEKLTGIQLKTVDNLIANLNKEIASLRSSIEDYEITIRNNTENSFNFDEAKEEVKEQIEQLKKDLQTTISSKELNCKSLKSQRNEMMNNLIQKKQQFEDLKLEIKSSYENLEPNYNSYNMLTEFFLGFDNNDNISTFEYRREPYLLVFNGKNEKQHKALLQMIRMMLCQILCNMTPLAYHINIIDMETAGVELMEFTASSTGNQNELVSLVINNAEYNSLINSLYDNFKKRSVLIKTSFENIETYNDDRLKVLARTLPYILNIFYNFEITSVSKDIQMSQINKVGSDLGLDNIYTLDLKDIAPPKSKSSSDPELNLKKYQFEDYLEFIKIFKPENILSFNTDGEEIKIINISDNEIQDIIKT